jgi:pectate lyase
LQFLITSRSVTKGSDFVTISWNYFHTHWKTSLVGGDPEAAATESDKYHITYHNNYWRDLSTRTPALRFSTAHVFNNFYEDISAVSFSYSCWREKATDI